MALKVSKPGQSYGEKPKLSRTGKIIVACAALAAVALIAVIISAANARGRQKEAEAKIITEIDRASAVCAGAMTTLRSTEGEAGVKAYADEISKAKKIEDKLRLTQDMLNYALQLAVDNQSLTDELNGARNRIFVAQREYSTN